MCSHRRVSGNWPQCPLHLTGSYSRFHNPRTSCCEESSIARCHPHYTATRLLLAAQRCLLSLHVNEGRKPTTLQCKRWRGVWVPTAVSCRSGSAEVDTTGKTSPRPSLGQSFSRAMVPLALCQIPFVDRWFSNERDLVGKEQFGISYANGTLYNFNA